MRKKPKKPTNEYGYIRFGKDGTVKKCMFKLSSDKEVQEKEVVNHFVDNFNKFYPDINIKRVDQLQESDNDFLLTTCVGEVLIELTGLVELDYTKEITQDEYNKGLYSNYIIRESGKLPLAIDIERRDTCLLRLIIKKLNKHYAKPRDTKFWLVIFCTSLYLTAYHKYGLLHCSQGLNIARSYIEKLDCCVFDQIWFTDMLGQLVRIWPYT